MISLAAAAVATGLVAWAYVQIVRLNYCSTAVGGVNTAVLLYGTLGICAIAAALGGLSLIRAVDRKPPAWLAMPFAGTGAAIGVVQAVLVFVVIFPAILVYPETPSCVP
jgi:hypothetical protein